MNVAEHLFLNVKTIGERSIMKSKLLLTVGNVLTKHWDGLKGYAIESYWKKLIQNYFQQVFHKF